MEASAGREPGGLLSPQRLVISRVILVSLAIPQVGMLLSIDRSVGTVYFRQQDFPVLLIFLGVVFAMTWRIPRIAIPQVTLRWPWMVGGAVILALVLWWGTYAVLCNYPLTRDEHMVLFDMGTFARGRLIEPLAAEWRTMVKGIVPAFAVEVPGWAGLASGYLPGNAMLRLLFSKVADPALMNPVLFAISILALFDIARRLFPDDRRAVVVTMLLYVASAQVLVTAMTAYAMTAHTALNLIWLMLFLRDRPWGHALAMVISVIACGLHQVVFHPLFAGPLLLWRLRQGRYALFATYTAVFAAAILMWVLYPSLSVRSAGITAGGGAGEATYYWHARVLALLNTNFAPVLPTLLNAARYLAWNHLAVLPLVLAAWPAVRANLGPALPLAAGIILTLVFCALVLPFQGHGWGYRYVCGVLGNAAILGGIGYQCWAARNRAAVDGLFVSLTILTGCALIFLVIRAHQFVEPAARLDRLIDTIPTDMVLIDTEPPHTAIDLVRNQADLSNRPIRLSSYHLSVKSLRSLCDRGTIALVTRRDMIRTGLEPGLPLQSRRFDQKVKVALAGRPCLVSPSP